MFKWIYFSLFLSFCASAAANKSVILTAEPSGNVELSISGFSDLSDDGSALAYTGGNLDGSSSYNPRFRLFYHDISNSERYEIKSEPDNPSPILEFNDPKLSPDGELVLARGYREGPFNQRVFAGEVAYDVKSKKLQPLLNSNGEEFNNVAFSARFFDKGKNFYFLSRATNVLDDILTAERRLYRFNWESQTVDLILDDLDYVELIDTSVDGSIVVLMSTRTLDESVPLEAENGQPKLYIFNTQTNQLTYIPTKRDEYYYSSITAKLSFDGKYVSYQESSNSVITLLELATGDSINIENALCAQRSTCGNGNLLDIDFEGKNLLLGYENHVWTYDVTSKLAAIVSVDNNEKPVNASWYAKHEFSKIKPQLVLVKEESRRGDVRAIDLSQLDNSKVESPTNLISEGAFFNKIKLSWRSHSSIFRIYRSLEGGEKVYRGSVTESSFEDTDTVILDSGLQQIFNAENSFNYAVEACNDRYVCSDAAQLSDVSLSFPPEIDELKIEGRDNTQNLYVNWPSVEGASYYNVNYRHGFSNTNRITYASEYRLDAISYRDSIVSVSVCFNGYCGEENELVVPQSPPPLGDLRYFLNQTLDKITFHWNQTVENGYVKISQYSSQNDEEVLGTSSTNSLTVDLNDEHLNSVRFRIYHCSSQDNCSNQQVINTDINETVGALTENRIDLQVNSNANHNVITYWFRGEFERLKLYRRNSRFGEEGLINSSDVGLGSSDYQYVDSDIIDSTYYYYRLEGCINDTCLSSNEEGSARLSGYLVNLGSTQDLSLGNELFQDKVELTWSRVSNADSISVLRRTTESSDFYIIATLSGNETAFTDWDIEPGTIYFYAIEPNLESEKGLRSNVVSTRIKYDEGQITELPPPEVRSALNLFKDNIKLQALSTHPLTSSIEYFVYDNINGEPEVIIADSDYDDYSVFLYGLEEGETRIIRARACSYVTCSNLSETIEARTSDAIDIPSSRASAPVVKQVSKSEAQITIEPLEDASYYKIHRRYEDTGYVSEQIAYFPTFIDSYLQLDRVMEYSVTACNLVGCSAQSITTKHTQTTENYSNTEVIVYDASLSREEDIIVSYRLADMSLGQLDQPAIVNLYISDSFDGEKSLIYTDEDFQYHSSFEFVPPLKDELYYFWAELCVEDICKLSDRFESGKSVEEETIPKTAPVIEIADIKSLGSVFFKWDSAMNSVEKQIYFSETLNGEKTFINGGTENNPFIVSKVVQAVSYAEKPLYFWGRNCFGNKCSDFSEPVIASNASLHTNGFEYRRQDKLLHGIHRIDKGEEILDLEFDSTLQQRIYIEKGFTLVFSFKFSKQREDDTLCREVLNLGPTGVYDRFSQGSYKRDLLKVFHGGGNCEIQGMSDEDKIYFIVGEDTSKIFSFEPEQSEEVWHQLKLVVEENLESTLLINNRSIGSSVLNDSTFIDPAFVQFQFENINSRDFIDTYIKSLKIESDQFSPSRPLPLNRISYSPADEASVQLYVSASHLEILDDPIANTDFWYIEKDGSRTQVWSKDLALSELEKVFFFDIEIPKNGLYLATAKSCLDDLCSSQESSLILVDSYTEVTDIIATPKPESDSLDLTWIKNAANTVKVFTGLEADSLSLFDEVSSNRITISNISSPGIFVSLQACKNDICTEPTSPIAVSMDGDFDGDGLTDTREKSLGTDLTKSDTDDDGLGDFDELIAGTDPLNPDTDGDGILDGIDLYPTVKDRNVISDKDANGDGMADILWRNQSDGRNWMWTMDGRSILTSAGINTIADPAWQIVGRGDFDGDGKSDVLWRNSETGRNWVYLMDGFTIRSSQQLNYVTDNNWYVKGVGDFDGDGKDDVIWRHAVRGDTWVYLMNGTQIRVSQGSRKVADLNWEIVAVGDVNGDSKDDVIWRHATRGDNYIWLMNGGQLSSGYVLNRISTNWEITGAGDLNGDGTDDIIWRNKVDGRNWGYLMNGGQIQTSQLINTVSSQDWQMADILDLDGDGKVDIFWRNSSDGRSYIFLMDGTSIKSQGFSNTVGTSWETKN